MQDTAQEVLKRDVLWYTYPIHIFSSVTTVRMRQAFKRADIYQTLQPQQALQFFLKKLYEQILLLLTMKQTHLRGFVEMQSNLGTLEPQVWHVKMQMRQIQSVRSKRKRLSSLVSLSSPMSPPTLATAYVWIGGISHKLFEAVQCLLQKNSAGKQIVTSFSRYGNGPEPQCFWSGSKSNLNLDL